MQQHGGDAATAVVRPWRESVKALAAWARARQASRPHGAPPPPLADLAEMLDKLARGEVAVPVQVPRPATGPESVAARPEAEAARRRWRARRVALVRLAAWRTLHALRERTAARPAGALLRLLDALAAAAPPLPPGLAPTLAYAQGEKASEFFTRELRPMLALLADRHPACAAQLQRLASTGHDVASVAGAHAWGEAWSMGIAVNYLDGLHHRAVGSVDDAMALLWSNEALQLHAHARLALLPAAAKHLHMELWTDFVQAQALEHRDTRFATPTAWHRVTLDMHDLGATEKGRRRERFDRGLQVGLIHLPVFTNRAELALQHLGPPAAGEEAGGAAAAGSGRAVGPAAADIVGAPIVLELPALAPGQAANFQLLVRLRDPTRRAAPADTVALDAGQHEVFARWRAGRGSVGAARELDAATLDWQASAGGPDEATEGFELGSCALWRALRESHAGPGEEGEAQWLDLALVIRRGGRWSLCPLELGAREVRGELHCLLALEPEDDSGGGAAPAQGLRHALAQPGRARWVATPAGLGALVMVGVDLDAGGVRA